MENRPPISSSPLGSISSYRKRRQRRGSNIVYIIAGVLVVGGVILLLSWLFGSSKPLNALFATETPTPTMTFTPTSTSTPTETPTVTPTDTITPTPTFSTPFNYTVQDNKSLYSIAEKFNLGEDGIALILLLNPYNPDTFIGIDPQTQIVIPGQIILLPNPGMQLPTATIIPPDLPRGQKEEYIVQSGDTLAGIAALYSSTIEAIMEANGLTDPNDIDAGDLLLVPVNMVTATPTRPPTSTSVPPGPGTDLPTTTITPIN